VAVGRPLAPMPKPPLARDRVIGIAAHVDAGKTTLSERILFYAGVSHRLGEVHDGAAHMDYMAEEQAHGITITAAVTRAPWRDHRIQIVDTPGHVDFTLEVERTLRVLDGCVLVLDGVHGVEPQTETVWRQRERFRLPGLCFVNKLDRVGADFTAALESLRRRLHADPVALTLPVDGQAAVIDLLRGQLVRFAGDAGEDPVREPCPPDLWAQAAPWRESLGLAAAEYDAALEDLVLAGEDLPPEAALTALRRGVLAGELLPCFAGSALRNWGVQPLMDAIVDLLPAPGERPPPIAQRPGGSEEAVALDPKGPLAALAFKVKMWDGRRHVFARIYRGTLRPGDRVAAPRPGGEVLREHVARLFDVDAQRRRRIDVARAGEIVLLAGLRRIATGDTLCDPDHLLNLEPIEIREPVLALALEPASEAEGQRLLEALDKLLQEDPSLRLSEDPDSGQRLLAGMGELHLAIAFERLEHDYCVRPRTGEPRVARRETPAAQGRLDYLFEPPAAGGGPALKAGVSLAVRPLPRGAGVRLRLDPEVRPAGARLNEEQRVALEQGLRFALSGGPAEGAPVEDLEVALEAVELFGTASTPAALRAAASRALHQALEQAGTRLLGPIMDLEVEIPSEYLGAVLGDLQARHGLVLDTITGAESARIRAEAPLDRLLGYATELRGLTQGRGQFSMQLNRFDRVR